MGQRRIGIIYKGFVIIHQAPDYAINKNGIVKRITPSSSNNCKIGCIRKGTIRRGYRVHKLSKHEGGNISIRHHAMLLEAFVCKRPKGLECMHLNGNKLDNNIKNLKWGTHQENMSMAVKHGWKPFIRKHK